MIKRFTIAVLLLTPGFLYAQITTTSPDNGNVGIGVVPQVKLHVASGNVTAGSQIFKALRLSPASGSGGYNGSGVSLNLDAWTNQGSGTVAAIWSSLWAGGNGNNNFSGAMVLGTKDDTDAQPTERMRITKDGKLGIGTTTPFGKLQVDGTTLLAGQSSNVDPGIEGNLSYLANSAKVLIAWNRTGGSGEIDFIGNQGPAAVGGFAFYQHGNDNVETKLMSMTGGGQMIIGPGYPNIGSHRLAVDGSLIATEVVVKAKGNWPDYVFSKDYHLPSIKTLAKYITANNHLPEMPSAKEVESNGVELAEMNKLLLKKVEELTLYLIAKDKEDAKRDQELENLKAILKNYPNFLPTAKQRATYHRVKKVKK